MNGLSPEQAELTERQVYALSACGICIEEQELCKTYDDVNALFKKANAERAAFKQRTGHDPCPGALLTCLCI